MLPPGMVAPVMVTLLEVLVTTPFAQFVKALAGLAMASVHPLATGNVSVSDAPVSGVAEVFLNQMVNRAVCVPEVTVAELNAFTTLTLLGTTKVSLFGLLLVTP